MKWYRFFFPRFVWLSDVWVTTIEDPYFLRVDLERMKLINNPKIRITSVSITELLKHKGPYQVVVSFDKKIKTI